MGSGRKIWTKERGRKGKEETRGRRERYRVLNVSNSIIPNAQRKVANSIRGPFLPLEYHPFDFANNVFVSSPLSDFSPPRPEEEPGRSILKYRDTLNIVSPVKLNFLRLLRDDFYLPLVGSIAREGN